MPKAASPLLSILLALGLAACSSTGGSQTGFLSGGGDADATATTQQTVSNDPDTRVMQLAWNTARADKCGFQFNAPRMRASYLAWEGELGAAPEEIARYASGYDQSGALFRARIKAEPIAEYCSGKVVSDIRSAMTQYIAGDFSARSIYKRPVIIVQEENQAASAYLKSMTAD